MEVKVNLNFEQLLKLILQLPKEQKKQIQTKLGEELQQPVEKPVETKRKAGALKGFVTYMAEDFDAPLEDMKPYME